MRRLREAGRAERALRRPSVGSRRWRRGPDPSLASPRVTLASSTRRSALHPGRWPGEDGGLEGPQPPGCRVGLEQLSRARARGERRRRQPRQLGSGRWRGPEPRRAPSGGGLAGERETASLAWYRPLAAPATGGPQMPRISVPGSPTLTCEFVNFS